MSDSSWDEYTAEEVSAEVATTAPDLLPTVDAAATDLGQGDAAASWGDWNQEIADDASADAASEIAYANEAYASGFDGAGDSALNRADIALDTAASHDATAGDYYSSAEGEYAASADGYATAAEDLSATPEVDETTGYDTALGTTSYDTAVGTTSYDIPVDTTGYDTAVGTTGYDTTSYDTGVDTISDDAGTDDAV